MGKETIRLLFFVRSLIYMCIIHWSVLVLESTTERESSCVCVIVCRRECWKLRDVNVTLMNAKMQKRADIPTISSIYDTLFTLRPTSFIQLFSC